MKNVIGWLKFNEELDNNKEENECTCGEDPCTCKEDDKVEEKKKNPFAKMNAEKKDKGDKKKADKKEDKGGKKELTAAQKKLPWNKGK